MKDLNFSPIKKNIDYNPTKRMVCKFDTEGVIEYVNEDLVAFTGFEPFEIIGKNVKEIRHPDNASVYI